MTRVERVLATPWPLTLAVAILIALPILAQGELSAADARSRAHQEQLAATARIATQAAASVGLTVALLRDQVSGLASRAVTGKATELIAAIATGDADLIDSHLLEIGQAGGPANLRILDPSGKVIAPRGVDLGKSFADQPYWGRASPSVPIDISPVWREGSTVLYAVTAYVPQARGEQPVFLVTVGSVQGIAGRILQPLFSAVDELYVVDQDGRFVLRGSRAFSGDPDALKDLSKSPAVAQTLGAKASSFEGQDPFGRGHRFIASAVMPETGWRVIAEQASDTVEKGLDDALFQQRVVRGLLSALLLVATFLLARSASEVFRQRRVLATNERELRNKSAQLEAASRHKSEFLANMSHELRTPLNAIIGFSEVVISGMAGAVSDKQREYLDDVISSGRHLLSLINDILDLSKVEAGRMDLDLSEFSLRAAVDGAVTLVKERASRHRIELASEITGDLDTVVADERKLKQVLVNLLSNAVKFTPDGGRVEVRASPRDDAIEVSVRDTGVGISPEDQAKVFEEFRQAGSDRERAAEGTGLGLALTKKLVELHGGRIWVESQVGRGSTFTFTLPRAGSAQHNAMPTTTRPG